MTIKGINPSELPAQERKNPSKRSVTDEQVSEMIDLLKNGQAVVTDQSFKSQAQARRRALVIKRYVDEAWTDKKQAPSTRVYEDENAPKTKPWRFAIVLKNTNGKTQS